MTDMKTLRDDLDAVAWTYTASGSFKRLAAALDELEALRVKCDKLLATLAGVGAAIAKAGGK